MRLPDEINRAKARWVWVAAPLVAFVLSILGALRGGYVGPDYMTHFWRLTDWSRIFDFSATSGPAYYLLGHAIFKLIGSNNAFPITLSILQAAANCLALWWLFRFLENAFTSSVFLGGYAVFAALLPVRVIHSATLGTDSATVPLFVLLLWACDKILRAERRREWWAAVTGLLLSVAVATKYSFIAFVPALLVLFAASWWRGNWSGKTFLNAALLSLLLPVALMLGTLWASSQTHGYNTEKHWLKKGIPPDMDYKDLLSFKRADLQLFGAPEYFKGDLLHAHKHGYLALAHFATFSDPMNIFQELPARRDFGSILIPDQKTRRPWKTPVMAASICLGAIWTVAAVVGTARSLTAAAKHLCRGALDRQEIATFFGVAYFLLLYVPIAFVHGGALFGYWTPRLILPALLCFFAAAFLLLETLANRYRALASIITALVVIQCALAIAVLI